MAPQVTNVRVVYGRKRQPAQYESSSAEIEFTATIPDDANHVEAAKQLLADAKTLVLTELGIVKAGDSASAHVIAAAQTGAAAAETGEPAAAGKRTRKAKDTSEPQQGVGSAPATQTTASPGPASSTAPSAAASIPADDGAVAASGKTETALGRGLPASAPGTTTASKPTGGAGIPVDEGTSSPAPAAAQPKTAAAGGTGNGAAVKEAVTPAGVQKYVTQCLVQKKFLPPVVLGILKADYKVDRVADLVGADGNVVNLVKFYNAIRQKAGDAPIAG